jgi:hypothetical protein
MPSRGYFRVNRAGGAGVLQVAKPLPGQEVFTMTTGPGTLSPIGACSFEDFLEKALGSGDRLAILEAAS